MIRYAEMRPLMTLLEFVVLAKMIFYLILKSTIILDLLVQVNLQRKTPVRFELLQIGREAKELF